MQHKVKVTVIDKKLYSDLQAEFCADPDAGACPCYHVGDEFLFERYGKADDFWHMGLRTLKNDVNNTASVAGKDAFPHCSEAWDAISRYIYTGLQGGSIMRGWMKEENTMIACCSDGTRPVIFKIERLDYKAVYVEGISCDACRAKIRKALEGIEEVKDVIFRKEEGEKEYIELFLDKDIGDDVIRDTVQSLGEYQIVRID